MDDAVVGIRRGRYGPLVFCYTGDRTLARGDRVQVAVSQGVWEGIVAIAPAQIIAAPPLPDAPRVVDVAPAEAPDEAGAAVPPGIVFLPAEEAEIGPADLARALALAALPVPEPVMERR